MAEKLAPHGVIREVVDRWKVSPLNAQRWNATLDCGHDLWVTNKRKPTTPRIMCPRCTEANREASRSGA